MSRCILLVDDHPDVRRMLGRLLGSMGHRVGAEADCCAGALEPRSALVDTAVIDVMLPDGSGIDLADQLLDLHPELRIVLISSHGAEELGARVGDPRFAGFLHKPDLSPATLGAVLR